MPYDQTLLGQKAEKVLTHVKKDIASLRTGKASVQLLDPVVVEVYGSKMKIPELANVSIPDANLLVITPWDKNIIADLEKAINSSDLNLNPVVDGDKIRIVVPQLTEERRKEMVKTLQQKIENAKTMLRSVRTEIKKQIEDQKGGTGISEDDIERDLEDMEKSFKEYMEQLEEIAKKKEKELLTI
ncbi:MAG: ribosome recycling factor [Candidatus Woesebacteria bacterium]|jgi:ribosome recycling factor